MTENGVAPVAPDDDRTPTQEDVSSTPKPAAAWVMPEPVFRRSEGYTPKPVVGSEDETITPDTIMEPSDLGSEDQFAAAPDIGEQPDVSEDLISETVSTPEQPETTAKKKGGFFKVLLILVGIAIVILVGAAAILIFGLEYFLHIFSSESQNLN
jgi:hypothetical protein